MTRTEVERLASLESEVKGVKEEIAEARAELRIVLATFERWKGAAGMLAMMGSMLTAAIGLFVAWLKAR